MTDEKSVLINVLGLDPTNVIGGGSYLYEHFEIKSRNKMRSTRHILAPCEELKVVQRAVLERVLNQVSPHRAATAFFKGRSVLKNAIPHHRCLHLFKTDISDFFQSIKTRHITRVLETHFPHLSKAAMEEIIQLTTLNGCLPQGAPTSPHLANLALFEFDDHISSLCERIGAKYTRYADDITISASNEHKIKHLEAAIGAGLSELGLVQHLAKTRRFGPFARKLVTGLDVSGAKIRPPRSYRKKTAALVRMCETYPGQMERHVSRVMGYLAYWQGTSPDDPELATLKKRMIQFLKNAPLIEQKPQVSESQEGEEKTDAAEKSSPQEQLPPNPKSSLSLLSQFMAMRNKSKD